MLAGNQFVASAVRDKIAEVFPDLVVVPCQFTGQYGALAEYTGVQERDASGIISKELDRRCLLTIQAYSQNATVTAQSSLMLSHVAILRKGLARGGEEGTQER